MELLAATLVLEEVSSTEAAKTRAGHLPDFATVPAATRFYVQSTLAFGLVFPTHNCDLF